MRLLVLAGARDGVADAVAARAVARGAIVERRTLHDLATACWSHRLGAAGIATAVVFADGGSVAAFGPDRVFNRLVFRPTFLFPRLPAGDRHYAAAEFHALLLSWLASLGGAVVNGPVPPGLAGPALRPAGWARLAIRAGLPVFPGTATTNARLCRPAPAELERPDLLPAAGSPDAAALGAARPAAFGPAPASVLRLLVVEGNVAGREAGLCGPATREGCAALARLAGASCLLVDLARTSGDAGPWCFAGADPLPPALDDAMLDALLDRLCCPPSGPQPGPPGGP